MISLPPIAGGIWLCVRGARLLARPDEPFWPGLDQMLRGTAGFIAIGMGVACIAIGILVLYRSTRFVR